MYYRILRLHLTRLPSVPQNAVSSQDSNRATKTDLKTRETSGNSNQKGTEHPVTEHFPRTLFLSAFTICFLRFGVHFGCSVWDVFGPRCCSKTQKIKPKKSVEIRNALLLNSNAAKARRAHQKCRIIR